MIRPSVRAAMQRAVILVYFKEMTPALYLLKKSEDLKH